MSKRLKNYPDPAHILDTYGADALRLYMINSPIVRAEGLCFTEEGVVHAAPVAAANAILVLITRTLATLDRLFRRVAEGFTRDGGATERMMAARVAYRKGPGRTTDGEEASSCPECGEPKRVRNGPYGEFFGVRRTQRARGDGQSEKPDCNRRQSKKRRKRVPDAT